MQSLGLDVSIWWLVNLWKNVVAELLFPLGNQAPESSPVTSCHEADTQQCAGGCPLLCPQHREKPSVGEPASTRELEIVLPNIYGTSPISLNSCYAAYITHSDTNIFSSVAQSCPILCNPMDCSTPGFPVHRRLVEHQLDQTHVHRVSDAIQPSHPLSSPSPPAFNLSQHQDLFQWVNSSHQVAKVLELQPQHQSFQWIFRTDFLYDWLASSPCSPRDSQESSSTLQFKSITSLVLNFLYDSTLTSIHD